MGLYEVDNKIDLSWYSLFIFVHTKKYEKIKKTDESILHIRSKNKERHI